MYFVEFMFLVYHCRLKRPPIMQERWKEEESASIHLSISEDRLGNEEAMHGFTGNLVGGADGKAWYVGCLTTDV